MYYFSRQIWMEYGCSSNSSLLFTHKCQRGCLLLISITAPQRDGHAEITGNTQPINPNIPRIISRFYMKVQFIFRFFMWKKPLLANYQILKVHSKEAGSLKITFPQYNGSVVETKCIILRHPAALCRRELHNCVH